MEEIKNQQMPVSEADGIDENEIETLDELCLAPAKLLTANKGAGCAVFEKVQIVLFLSVRYAANHLHVACVNGGKGGDVLGVHPIPR